MVLFYVAFFLFVFVQFARDDVQHPTHTRLAWQLFAWGLFVVVDKFRYLTAACGMAAVAFALVVWRTLPTRRS